MPQELSDQLDDSIEDFKDHIKQSSSEASFRSMFWDSVFNHMFRSGLKGNPRKPFTIEPEWKTRTLFPYLDDRKVDLAVLFKPFENSDQQWPILLVEMGKQSFDLSHPPKDFSKLLELMSQTCIRLAYAMVKAAENLIIYGIWIGDGAFKFCTAHPVVTRVDLGNNLFKYEIHCHLTSEKHWDYHLLSRPCTSVTEPCMMSNRRFRPKLN